MKNKSKELKTAIKAALSAGKILKKYFETEPARVVKEDESVLTAVDGKSEEIIKKIILEAFPDHSILGEETGLTKNTEEAVWYVDPIDGTRNFANGIPFTAISIALVKNSDLFVSVVYNPTTNTLFYAEKGKGAYWNDKKIHVSKDEPKQAIVTCSSGKKEEDWKIFRGLLHDLPVRKVKTVRDFGCACLNLAYVARGSTEAEIQMGLNTYDFAAGVLLVKEAGGKVTKLDGSPWQFPESHFIASNRIFHDLLVEEIKSQKKKINL